MPSRSAVSLILNNTDYGDNILTRSIRLDETSLPKLFAGVDNTGPDAGAPIRVSFEEYKDGRFLPVLAAAVNFQYPFDDDSELKKFESCLIKHFVQE